MKSHTTLCLKGSIKWFNAEKGFGFAVPDGMGVDVLFDLSSIHCDDPITLRHEQRVYMEITQQSSGGYSATHILPLD